MINQIRADFYRQLRTRGVWLVALLTIIYAVVVVGFQSAGGVMVNAPMKLLNQLAAKDWSVYDGLHGATISSSVLLYLFIALFVVVIGYEFSQKIYKNTLISGISRLQFIMAKYVTLLIDLFIGMGLYYLTVILTGVLAGRPMGASWPHLLGDTGTTLVSAAFFISVIFSLAVLVLIATTSLVISTVFIVIWPLAIAMLNILTNWHWLTYADFFNTATGLAFGTIATADLWRYIVVSVLALVVSILAAAGLIRNREL